MKRNNVYLLLLSYVFFSVFICGCKWGNKNLDIESIKSDTENFITSIYTPSTDISDAMLKVKNPENRNALGRYLEGKKIEKKDEKVVEFLDYAIQKQNIHDNSVVYNKFLNDVTSDKLYQDIQSQISVFMQQKRVQNFINKIQDNSYNLFPNKKAILKQGKWEDKNNITAKVKEYKENKEENYEEEDEDGEEDEKENKEEKSVEENEKEDNKIEINNKQNNEIKSEIEINNKQNNEIKSEIVNKIKHKNVNASKDKLKVVAISDDGKIGNIQIVNKEFVNLVNVYKYTGSSDNYEREKNKFLNNINPTGETYLYAYVEVKRVDTVKLRYFIHCKNANSIGKDFYIGLFQGSEATKIEILSCGSEIKNMSALFRNCSSLTNLNLSKLNTNNVKDMRNMFYNCSSLTELDLSNFNTENVTDMYGMFAYCSSLTELDLSKFNTTKVTDMSYMFYYCTNLTELDLSKFNTKKVTDMILMFFQCFKEKHTSTLICKVSTLKDVTGDKNDSCLIIAEKEKDGITEAIKNEGKQNTVYICIVERERESESERKRESGREREGLKNKKPEIIEIKEQAIVKEERQEKMISKIKELNKGIDNRGNSFCGELENEIEVIIDDINCLVLHQYSDLEKVDISNDGKIDNIQIVSKNFAKENLVKTYKYKGSSDNYKIAKNKFLNGINPTGQTYLSAYVEVEDNNKVKLRYFIHCTNANSKQAVKTDNGLFEESKATKIVILRCGSEIKDMYSMFCNCSSLEELDLSNFNTINVTDMQSMFENCSSLTILDLSKFNTTNATDMNHMFHNCSSLTNIKFPDNFNTTNVTDMSLMFYKCSGLTKLDLSSFNTNNVTNMSLMFYNCSSLTNLDLSNFNTKKVEDMRGMFDGCSSLTELDLSNFNTNNVTDMQYMFANCFKNNATLICQASTIKKIANSGGSYLTIPNDNEIKKTIANENNNIWEVYKCSVKRVGDNPEITKVEEYLKLENMPESGKIDGKQIVNAEFAKENLVNVYKYTGSSDNYEREKNKFLKSINTTGKTYLIAYVEVGDTARYFIHCKNANSTIDNGLFYGSEATKIEILSCGSEITNMSNMFCDCSSLTNLDLSNFNNNTVENMVCMFSGCSKLTKLDLSNFNTSGVKGMGGMFNNCFKNEATLICKASTIKKITGNENNSCLIIENKENDKINDELNKNQGTVYRCSIERNIVDPDSQVNITQIKENAFIDTVNIPDDGKIGNIQVVNAEFAKENLVKTYVYEGSSDNYEAAKKEFMDKIDTTCETYLSAYVEVKDNGTVTLRCFIECKNANSKKINNITYGLFQGSAATKIEILSCGSEIENMRNMFYNCTSLTELDLSSLYTDNVTNMECMFVNCSSLTGLDLSNFNTNNVTNMRGMFCQCSKLTNLDLSNFDTTNVTDMGSMFFVCSELTNLDLSSFNTNNVINMQSMFYSCSKLKVLNLSNFNTKNVTNMTMMFAGCSSLKVLFCNNFDMSSNPDIGYIFQNTCIPLLYLPGNVLNFFIKISKQHCENKYCENKYCENKYIITCDYNSNKKSGEDEKYKLVDNKQNEKGLFQGNFINNVVYICDISQECTLDKNEQVIKNVYTIKVFLRNWLGENDNGREMLLKKVFIVMLLRNLYCSVCNNHGYNLLYKYTPKQDIMMCLHIISLIDRGDIYNTSYDKYLSMFLYMKLKSSLTYNLSYNNDIKEIIVKNNKSLQQENIKNELQQGDMNIKINTYTGQNFTLQKESEDVFALRKYKIYNSYFCNEVYLSKVDNNEDFFSNNIKECLNIPEVDRGKGLLAFVVVDNEKYLVYCKNANSQQFFKNINNDTIQIYDSYYKKNHILNNTHNPQNNINIDNNTYNICGLFEGSEASDIYILIFGEGITHFANAFKDCVKLKKLDLTGIIYYMTILNITNIFYNAFVLGTSSEIIANVGFMELNVDNNNIDIKKSSNHQVRNVLANNSAYTICKFLIERTYQDNGVNVYMGGYRFLNIISAQKNNETTCYLMSTDDLLLHASISDDAGDYVQITLPTKKKNSLALSYKTFNKEIQCKKYNINTYTQRHCEDIANVFSKEFVKSRLGNIGYYNISADSIHYNAELEEKFYAKKCQITNEENNTKHILIFVKFNDNNVEKTYIIYCDDASYKGYKYGLFSGSEITSIVFLSCGEEIGSVKYMFCNCNNLTYVDLSKLKITNDVSISEIFLSCFDTKSECTLIIPDELENSVGKELISNFDIQKKKN